MAVETGRWGTRRVSVLILAVTTAIGFMIGASGCAGTTPAQRDVAPTNAANWSPPGDVLAAAEKAGLPMLDREMLAVHEHAHLDVIVNGRPVIVPADLGINADPPRISPLHTHDSSGIVHIESADRRPFTLGQLFTLWGQPLSATLVGPVKVAAPQTVKVFENGQLVKGDPAALVLHQHAEIVVWVGPASQTPEVPAKYSFPPNL